MIPSRHKSGFALLEVMVGIAVISMTSMSVIGLQTALMTAVSKKSLVVRNIFLMKNVYAAYAERQFKEGLPKELSADFSIMENKSEKNSGSWLETFTIQTVIPSVPERDFVISWYVAKKPAAEKE